MDPKNHYDSDEHELEEELQPQQLKSTSNNANDDAIQNRDSPGAAAQLMSAAAAMSFSPQVSGLEVNSFGEPIIHNIVATANLGCVLDLAKIVVRVRNAEYNPKRFRAVIMRILEPRTTAMIFASGRIVCTGSKSERLACTAVRKFGTIMRKIGYEDQIKFSEFKIQNIVSTVNIKFPVRLDKLALVHSQFCTYDPDFFPALIYRMVRPRTVLLIFVSGKVIITGAKSRQEIIDTMNRMTPVLFSFRKNQSDSA